MVDAFDVVDVGQDENGMVKLREDDVHDADVEDEVPDTELEILSCSGVLYAESTVSWWSGSTSKMIKLSKVMYRCRPCRAWMRGERSEYWWYVGEWGGG